jgi:tetratricopeptide (TPR) repeat protein
MSAAELKEQGNQAFKDGRFDEAVRLYTHCIDLDPKNIVYFNNRAAAQHRLGKYNEAIADAKRSNSISSNSKAHVRMAEAYWALGKLEMAKDCYDMAVVAAPGDQAIRAKLQEVRSLILLQQNGGRPPATAAAPPPVHGDLSGMYADLVVVCLAAVHMLTFLFSTDISMLAWRFMFAAMAARQGLELRQMDLLRPSMDALKQLPQHFAGLFFGLSVLGFVVVPPPLHLLLVAMALYCVVDAVTNFHGVLIALPLPPVLRDRTLSLVDKARANKDYLLANAAMCEASMAFFVLLSGAPMVFAFAYMQFARFRYRSDQMVQFAFRTLRDLAGKLFHHRLAPPVIGNLFDKLCGLLHSYASA